MGVVTGITLRVMGVCVVVIGLALLAGLALPGGGQIAYASARDGDLDIYLLDLARGMTLNLTDTPENENQPAWSPDGARLAFMSDRAGNNDIYTIQVRCAGWLAACGDTPLRLTTDPASDFDPAWSPGGAQIAFTSERFGYNEILTVASDGGLFHRLTDNDSLDANPAWSPDGRQIAFSTDRSERWTTDIYVMNANGSDARRLLALPTNDFAPDWSPDGRRIAFASSGSDTGQLVVIDVATGELTRLLDDSGFDSTPDWSPDGTTLALVSFREGNYELYTLRPDCVGTAVDCLRRLTFTPPLEGSPAWRPG